MSELEEYIEECEEVIELQTRFIRLLVYRLAEAMGADPFDVLIEYCVAAQVPSEDSP